MKHTPGPWVAEPTPQDGDPEFDFTDKPFWIADCGGVGEVLAVVHITHDGEAEANAKLMAAAPNLLKAAHAAYHALKSYQYGNVAPALAEECSVTLLDAIAKAEGR